MQRYLYFTAVLAMDREPGGPRPRHCLRRQVLWPCRPDVLHLCSSLSLFFFYCVSALFQSLLYEACGRTVNPVNGAVGLLCTGNWHVCQAAVYTVLGGGTLGPLPELLNGGSPADEASEMEAACADMWKLQEANRPYHSRFSSSRSKVSPKRKLGAEQATRVRQLQPNDLDLRLTPSFSPKVLPHKPEPHRPGTPSMNSEESVTTTATCFEIGGMGDQYGNGGERKLLNLFL
uniref:LOB domain-containing protein 37 n=1 Tax=Rhizophora mucronata TaxID=61149 RepID=A0A2P2L5Y3_RHIMU